ncbi:MAG TPA: TonB family protein [Rhodothermales bacterium]|nr:TonB family protein [Rhodothermales bacterium]
MFLPRLTVLNEQYAIGRTLDTTAAFSISYQAWDLKTEDQVDLREYFPSALAARVDDGIRVEARRDDLFRYGRDQFLKEAEVLAKIAHPNLVRQVHYFEANQTAYQAMEHHPGALLASVLQKKGGILPLKTAITLLMPVLEALQAAHQHGLMHGAISPGAIFLSKNNGPILRDFRTAHIMLAQRMGDIGTLVEEGMIAPEQHQASGKQGPWTDIYGAAAMMYELLAGASLPAGPQRVEQDDVPAHLEAVNSLTPALRDVLMRALSLDLGARPRSVQAFQQQLVQALEQKKTVVAAPPSVQSKAVKAQDAPTSTPASPRTPVAEKPAEPASVAKKEEPVSEKPAAKIEEEAVKATSPIEKKPAAAPVPATEDPVEISPDAPVEIELTNELESLPAAEEPVEETSAAEVLTIPSAKEWADRVTQAKVSSKTETKAPEPAPAVEDEPEAVEPLPVPEAPEKQEEAIPKASSAFSPSGPTKPSKATRKKDRKQQRLTDRASQPSQKRYIPVLVAFLVVSIVAVLGAFALLKNDGSEQTQFAYYKSQGDSLFALANYADAKAEYERALTAMPSNEEVAQQLDATNQRLAEVSAERYTEYMDQGDMLYDHADSLLQAGDALASLTYFNEANKAYYEALRYRPDDPVVLEKGQLTADGMDQALHQRSEEADNSREEESERVDPVLVQRELYDGYRRQGDTLFEQADYEGAREKYSLALSNQPGDAYTSNRIKEIDTLLQEASTEEQFQRHLTRGTALCNQGRCADAKGEFQRALELKPASAQAQAGMARADSMMASAQQQEQQYQYYRGQGDALATKGSYADAIKSYEQALTFKPGDAYIEQQITAASKAGAAKEEALSRRESEDGVYKVAEQAPQLIGGLGELHQKVEYPQKAYNAGVTGRVYVQFVVNEQGRVENAKVVRGIGSGCDEEALRVVKQARFEPGQVDGKPVKVQHTLFINFVKSEREEE